jgi:2'-5' RNA ligase
MRLFIAINFESDIVSALTDLQSGLRDCGAEGNFTRPENLHLTLAFIGEYGNPEEVLEILEEVPFRPVELKYAGLQYFRDMYFARFEDNPGLNSYVRRLRRALAEHDIPFDRKKFMPHITLIRRVDFKYGQLTDLPEEPELHITANRISLMKSEHGKNGMVYTELGGIE